MGRLKVIVLSGVLAMFAAAHAQAADMPGTALPLPPLSEKYTPMIEELVAGWYIRGDLGYRFQEVAGATSSATPSPSSNELEDAIMGGLGAGFKSKWFRLDFTGDYADRGTYTGTTTGALTYNTNIDSFTVMANGYIDLGTWAGLTPYVGAGIGAAYLTAYNYSTTPATLTAAPERQWNMAWSVMAGVTYNLSYNLMIDVGYRHVEMGDVETGPAANRLAIRDVSGDEIRIGLRYLLD